MRRSGLEVAAAVRRGVVLGLCGLAAHGCMLPEAHTHGSASEDSPDAGSARRVSDARPSASTKAEKNTAISAEAGSKSPSQRPDAGVAQAPRTAAVSGAPAASTPKQDADAAVTSQAGAPAKPDPKPDGGAAGSAPQTPEPDGGALPPPLDPGRTPTQSMGWSERDGTRGGVTPNAGETCYDLKVHGGQSAADTTSFELSETPVDHYEQFYFKPPWPSGTAATVYATKLDNAQVLHHWFLFGTHEAQEHGAHITVAMPTLTGIGPQLLAAWNAGSTNLAPPKGVGLELPGPEVTLNLQVHYANATGAPQRDASAIQICTVPVNQLEHIAAFTALGSEDLNGNVWQGGSGMPPNKQSAFSSVCVPGRSGMDASTSIQILGFLPHMHRLGKHMQTMVRRVNNLTEVIYDKPYSFGSSTHSPVNFELKPGEGLITTCVYFNSNNYGVSFGDTANDEMCYQFALAYPARALANGAPSLMGWPDTCW